MSLLSPQLQAFQRVAACKTVHGAAKELGITQTGVTQRIRALEESLSTTLFTRSRRGMLLTPEGEALYRYCIAAQDLEGATLAKIQSAGKKSSIRVCITGPTSIMRSRVVLQCKGVMRSFPDLLLHFQISDNGNGLEDLRTGAAQIAVMPPELVSKELDSKMLKPERYVLVGPRSWKNRPIQDLVKKERIIDFAPHDSMTFLYLKKFKLIDHARTDRYFVNSNESVTNLIESELGYGVLTAEFAERFLQRCEISILNSGKVLEQKVAMAWYPRPTRPAYWNALIRAIH